MKLIDVTRLTEELRVFAAERDWERFHSPKNLAMALSVEASELVEIFQWSTEEQSIAVKDDEDRRQAAADEIADVVIYATRIADRLGIDVADAVARKLHKNAEKYPAVRRI